MSLSRRIYIFYTIVSEKVRLMQQEAFVLDQKQLRIPLSDYDESQRECLVNRIAHTDYEQVYPSAKIEVLIEKLINIWTKLSTEENFMEIRRDLYLKKIVLYMWICEMVSFP